MKLHYSRVSAVTALAASLAMAATPVQARGWGHGHYNHRYNDGVDAGDIFTGLLVIGAIAAIASAADRPSRDSRQNDYQSRNGDGESEPEGTSSPAMDGAVDSCVDAVERDGHTVDTVDTVDREGDGWRVLGRADKGPFRCSVGRGGEVRDLLVGGAAA